MNKEGRKEGREERKEGREEGGEGREGRERRKDEINSRAVGPLCRCMQHTMATYDGF